MVEKQFRRHYQILAISIFFFVAYLLMVFNLIPLSIVVIGLLIVSIIIIVYFPCDFSYWIEDCGDFIFIRYNGSKLKLDKNLTMTLSTSKMYLVLEDIHSTLSIPYNYEVIKFLKEISN